MSMTRLGCGVLFGLLGVLFLMLAVMPLVLGQVEVGPTSLSIGSIESDGYPDAWYLNVTDGYIVFSVAEIMLEGDAGRGGTLKRITAPVVSESLWKRWEASIEAGAPPDAAKVRLLVSFNGEQVGQLWPEVKQQAEAGQAITMPPITLDLTGDTIEAKHMVYLPYEIREATENFRWAQARWLRHGRHFQSPGRFVKNLLIALALLAAALGTLTKRGKHVGGRFPHRRA